MTAPNDCPLAGLLDKIKAEIATNPVVVFDLDSTLFCNSGRTLAIFNEWANKKVNHRFHSLVKKIYPRTMLWSVDADFRMAGVPDEFLEGFTPFWADRFFVNDYIKYDRPMPGAPKFVNLVKEAGAKIIYATGRDEPRMGKGTRESLKEHGFPLDGDDAQLILKQDPKEPDVEFKAKVTAQIEKLGNAVGFFEDHPEYANIFQSKFPGASVITMNVPHPPDAPKQDPSLPRISDFLLPGDDMDHYLAVMSGLPATGKSTVAAIVAESLDAEHLSTDKIRAGMYADKNYPREVKYSKDAKVQVYTLLFEKTEVRLSKGQSAVMDGTFLKNNRQELADLADRHGAKLLFVKTDCDPADVEKRMNWRRESQLDTHFSEAFITVYNNMKAKLDSGDPKFLDVTKDPLVTEKGTPLVSFDTFKNTYEAVNTDDHYAVMEKLKADFPLYWPRRES